jgi:hypothetical protein
VKHATLHLASREVGRLKFGRLGVPLFAQRSSVKVTVADAQHRETWVASYPVVFALG